MGKKHSFHFLHLVFFLKAISDMLRQCIIGSVRFYVQNEMHDFQMENIGM